MTDTRKFNNKEFGDIDVVGMGEPSNATPPMSRTNQYRKVMKPLLERKRRARINSYLDELKDLMVTALQSEGESITKLEKADVLELTYHDTCASFFFCHAFQLPNTQETIYRKNTDPKICYYFVRKILKSILRKAKSIGARIALSSVPGPLSTIRIIEKRCTP